MADDARGLLRTLEITRDDGGDASLAHALGEPAGLRATATVQAFAALPLEDEARVVVGLTVASEVEEGHDVTARGRGLGALAAAESFEVFVSL